MNEASYTFDHNLSVIILLVMVGIIMIVSLSSDNKRQQKVSDNSILRQDCLKGIANQITKPNVSH